MPLSVLCSGTIAAKKPLRLTEKTIDKVVASMTLEEKANMIVGMSRSFSDAERADVGYTENILPGAAGTTYPVERLGISPLVFADGPAGLRINPVRDSSGRTYYCTGFPVGTLLASSWNDALVEKVGAAIGNEVLEYGADVLLAPGINIMRNPLCGRNFEYYSEDPLLAGKIAAAYIRGVQSEGVGTSVKHFAVNNQEINRLGNDSRLSERALREIYLRNFEIAVKESGPWTVMTSYNYVNGEYTSESYRLITEILREEWGYCGTVVTDWGGGLDAVGQVKAGNDMIQPGLNEHYETLVAALGDGSLKEEEIDACVKRILELIVKTPRYKGYAYSDSPDLEAHARVARDVAAEGMVLLRNDGVLPLKKSCEVALYGVGAYDFIAGGKGSGDVNKPYVVDLRDGLLNYGFTLNAEVDSLYSGWIRQERERLAPLKAARPWYVYDLRPNEVRDIDAAVENGARNSDVAVITVSRNSAEAFDRHIERDYMLHIDELALIRHVSSAFHAAGKKVVVMLNICGVIEMESWQDMADAVMICWQPGQEGGNSVASVISGEVSPSGHLPVSIPVSYADVPSQNFPLNVPETGLNQSYEHYSTKCKYYDIPNIDYTDYDEDIYVGYRHYATAGVPVSYPFGYGLTYSDFSLSGLRIERAGDVVTAHVRVRNTGDFEAKQVVQLYVCPPEGTEDRPAIELKGYAKTSVLAPDAHEDVSISFKVNDLAVWNGGMDGGWMLIPGKWKILVGTSSGNLPLSAELEVLPMR
ncbi:MAG: glycoside hydrolase family 3 C-terminal domain-containing protein [Bacteroidales bacterium]|nr:glycoside hydrolase family 3 C-terminal domain-containing protein [Bacteroidales bacterium]